NRGPAASVGIAWFPLGAHTRDDENSHAHDEEEQDTKPDGKVPPPRIGNERSKRSAPAMADDQPPVLVFFDLVKQRKPSDSDRGCRTAVFRRCPEDVDRRARSFILETP